MFAFAILLAAPLAVAAGPLQKRISGYATYYETQTGNAGACGSYLSDSDFIVAMNQVQYDQSTCGQTITITANGKTAQARIMDECPTGGGNCNYGDMDMSPGLFSFFADLGAGKIPIEWNFGGNAPQPQPTTTQAPPPPPPPPTTTTTWAPPPPTTTSQPPPPTTTSQPPPPPTTTSQPPSSSPVPPSSSSSSSTQPTSSYPQPEAAQETGSSDGLTTEATKNGNGNSNLSNLGMAMVNIGEMVRVAGGFGA